MSMWNKTTTAFVKKAAGLGQDYYPELLGKMCVANAPFVFTAIWSVVKSWVDEKTRTKVNIKGSDYMKFLKEHIDDDQIPEFLGGGNPVELGEDCGPW